jgi:hypothetical protein
VKVLLGAEFEMAPMGPRRIFDSAGPPTLAC